MSRTFELGKKRGVFLDVTDYLNDSKYRLSAADAAGLERLDAAYRALVSLLYNYVPTSGHPGGSISSGRFVEHLLYKDMAYDLSAPHKNEADIISYAAGHKALGLYALWALRNECARIAAPDLLPEAEAQQLRLEDLLGFRHNTVQVCAHQHRRQRRGRRVRGGACIGCGGRIWRKLPRRAYCGR